MMMSYDKVKKNDEVNDLCFIQESFLETQAIDSRIRQGVTLLEQGKIESIEELTKILVDKRPLDEIF